MINEVTACQGFKGYYDAYGYHINRVELDGSEQMVYWRGNGTNEPFVTVLDLTSRAALPERLLRTLCEIDSTQIAENQGARLLGVFPRPHRLTLRQMQDFDNSIGLRNVPGRVYEKAR